MLFAGTPGLITTSSIWSKSHEGTSPASSLTTPSPLSASASFDQSMNSFRSFKTTSAPRAAQKRTAATPLRPAPMTRTFLPSNSIRQKSIHMDGQDEQDEEFQIKISVFVFTAFHPAHPVHPCEFTLPPYLNFKVERLSSAK